jgi:hypothetical protein
LGSRYGDLYRDFNYNDPRFVWIDEATHQYAEQPNQYFRGGGGRSRASMRSGTITRPWMTRCVEVHAGACEINLPAWK